MAARFQQWFYKNIWNPSPNEERDGRIYGFKTPQPKDPDWSLEEILGSTSRDGQTISYETALTLSAFYRAESIKSGVLAAMPWKLYRRTKKGREEVRPSDHPVAAMFARKVSSKMTKTVYLERAMGQYDIKGNHYALIRRNGLGQAAELIYLPHDDVQVFETSEGVFYKIRGMDVAQASSKIIHVPNFGDGIVGKSILAKAAEDFALQMNARDYGSRFFADGGKLQVAFIPKEGARPTNVQRAELQNNYREIKKKSETFAVPAGWDMKELSVAPVEAGFLGAAQATVADIARWTGVPLHKLADMSAATRNNVEHQNIEFLQDTMSPIGAKFENEYLIKLLTLESEQDMYLEANWDAYIRPDTITKAEAFSKYIQNGVKTPNEVRAMNNDVSMGPAADKLFIQGATVPIDVQEKMLLSAMTRPQARKKYLDGQLSLEELLETVNTNGNGKH